MLVLFVLTLVCCNWCMYSIKIYVKGAITGCFSATVLLPSEVVKAKTQVVVGNTEASSADIYRKMIKRQGIRVSVHKTHMYVCVSFIQQLLHVHILTLYVYTTDSLCSQDLMHN